MSNTETRMQAAHTVMHECRTKVRELSRELKAIDGRIRDVEIRAARESDESSVLKILAERTRLVERKDALPFLIRGVKARGLRQQQAILEEEAGTLWLEVEAAESTVLSAQDRIAALKNELEAAETALTEATAQRNHLRGQHESLIAGAGSAQFDAARIEQGEREPLLEPNRFD